MAALPKLFINSEANKVVYAEVDKNCADFPFGILSMPMGMVVRLLQGHGTVGSLSNIYQSFENLDKACVRPGLSKDGLLALAGSTATTSLVPKVLAGDTAANKFYRCSKCSYLYYYTNNQPLICLQCNQSVYSASGYQSVNSASGYVKPELTYLVMDDLEIKPLLSTCLYTSLINKSGVKKGCALKEMDVQIGMKEAVLLLKVLNKGPD